ncbi:hypothetical protein Hanom_Chr11g00967931 [Helianthus anomalus]
MLSDYLDLEDAIAYSDQMGHCMFLNCQVPTNPTTVLAIKIPVRYLVTPFSLFSFEFSLATTFFFCNQCLFICISKSVDGCGILYNGVRVSHLILICLHHKSAMQLRTQVRAQFRTQICNILIKITLNNVPSKFNFWQKIIGF